jgi:predicted TIM-barrel fold metal-dependent hydrolase
MLIDMHIHVVPPGLPGVGTLNPILREPPETLARSLRAEMARAGITQALAMGVYTNAADDPLGIASSQRIARLVPGLGLIGVANPDLTEPEHFRRVERLLSSGQIRALKAYLGYLHYPPDHANYRRYYELAEQYRLPVIFHTGDTYSPYAKLKYAHPLGIDEVAVDHPNVRFVIAHVGNPWMQDAAEVVYKNVNVWVDVSGLVVGGPEAFDETDPVAAGVLADVRERLAMAFRYAERPNRFLFGTDWPLAPLTPYRDLIRSAIPPMHAEQVFTENAQRLFGLGP